MSDWPLYLLVLVLPFEPFEPLARWAGLEISTVELAAAVALGLVAASLARAGAGHRLREVPFGGLALALVGVGVLSALFAPTPARLPLKASARIAAGVGTFFLAALALRDGEGRRRLLGFVAAAGVLAAAFVLLEAAGAAFVEPLLAPFREQDFELAGIRRAAGTFSYPNTAGGFLVLCLPAAVVLATGSGGPGGRARLPRRAAALAAVAVMAAILGTYSRGALLGGLAGTATILLGLGGTATAARARRRAAVLLAGFVALAALHAAADPYVRLRAVSEGDASWYRAEYASEVARLRVEPGAIARVPVEVRNRGRLRWRPDGAKRFHLSYHWYDVERRRVLALEGERTPLPREVAPGDGARVEAFVRAPDRPGRYLLVWDMVQEGTTWFVGKGGGAGQVLPVLVGVATSGPTADARPAATLEGVAARFREESWFPGRLELWSLAWKLFRERPLLGVGPDNFRWLYGPAAGRSRWDTRVFANSLYLETLATTGLVGGAAFFGLAFGVMAAVTRKARKGLARSGTEDDATTSLALAAALVGFATHGLFDYLLEPTPIYLLFYLLLGAGAAALAPPRDGPASSARRHHACRI